MMSLAVSSCSGLVVGQARANCDLFVALETLCMYAPCITVYMLMIGGNRMAHVLFCYGKAGKSFLLEVLLGGRGLSF